MKANLIEREMPAEISPAAGKELRPKQSGAFTLTELLVVLAIIAILAGVLLPVLSKAKAQGQSAVCKNHLSQIGRAMQMYVSDSHRYPPALGGPPFQTWE